MVSNMTANMAATMASDSEQAPGLFGGSCSKCGGPLKIIGFMPHGQFENIRVELYRCLQCNQKSERLVSVE
jgi:hypothetical protein